MRSLITTLITISLLLMNFEGVFDMSSDLQAATDEHSPGHIHIVDSDDKTSLDQQGDCDDNQDHCSHGHSANIIGQLTAVTTISPYQFTVTDSNWLINHAQAPPTPPPNA